MDEDYLLAVRLQEQFNQENSDHQLEQVDSQSNSLDDQVILGQWLPKEENTRSESSQWSVVDPRWETIDPLPDARALFLLFNDKYFWGKLAGVEVRWSPRMTLCAGLCCYEGRGGLCSVRLSEPLLKLRPRSDFVNTLLHEMVHAYLFVTDNNKDHDGHGPEFHKHMHRINKESGSNITVYHTFHDEVANYKQHWWKCDGPCQKWSPYYGMVKRAMNRAPHPRDPWFPGHKQKCGGTYHKVKEPEGYGVKKSKKKDETQRKESPDKSTPGSRDIRNMFKREEKTPKEQKANKNKSIDLPPNVSVAPSHGPTAGPSDGLDDLPKFPGYGKSIGGSSQDSGQLGTIVRRIPGVGIITSRKPSATVTSAECMGNTHDNASSQNNSTNNSLDSDLNTTSRRMSDNRKRIIKEILDSDTDDDLFPVGSAKKRKPNSFDKFDLMDCTSPGAAAKIPGFKSVCDKSLDPSKFVSRAAGRNARALGLGSSSEESDDDCIPLGSVIKHTGDTRNDDKDTRQAKNRSTGRAFRELTDDSPPSGPDVNDNSGDRRTVEALPGLSIPPQVPAETMVNCPVCSLQLPQSQINMHLDTCLT